jgi:hypothetical protein
MATYGLAETKGCHSSPKDDVWRKAEDNKFGGHTGSTWIMLTSLGLWLSQNNAALRKEKRKYHASVTGVS